MKQILCFGDSNTYGYVPENGARYGWGERWTSIVSEKLTGKDYRVIEEGLCGRTTIFDDPLRDGRRGTELLPTLLETHNPVDAVVLMLGTNDCKTAYGANAEIIGKGIIRLLEQIERYAPHSRVLLVSPIHLGEQVYQKEFDPEFSESSIAVSKGLSPVYQRIAQERGIGFLDASHYASPSNADQEHMDLSGHARLAQAVSEKLLEMVA